MDGEFSAAAPSSSRTGQPQLTPEYALRFLHIAAGALGLLLGPIVMWAPKRPGLHPRLGDLYFFAVTVVCATALLLAGLRWAQFGFFFPIALGTYAIALPGYLAAKKRWRGWIVFHVVGQLSSYVAITSSFIVNNFQKITGVSGIPFAVRALVPMFIGTCLVAWFSFQVYLGKRPKS